MFDNSTAKCFERGLARKRVAVMSIRRSVSDDEGYNGHFGIRLLKLVIHTCERFDEYIESFSMKRVVTLGEEEEGVIYINVIMSIEMSQNEFRYL